MLVKAKVTWTCYTCKGKILPGQSYWNVGRKYHWSSYGECYGWNGEYYSPPHRKVERKRPRKRKANRTSWVFCLGCAVSQIQQWYVASWPKIAGVHRSCDNCMKDIGIGKSYVTVRNPDKPQSKTQEPTTVPIVKEKTMEDQKNRHSEIVNRVVRVGESPAPMVGYDAAGNIIIKYDPNVVEHLSSALESLGVADSRVEACNLMNRFLILNIPHGKE